MGFLDKARGLVTEMKADGRIKEADKNHPQKSKQMWTVYCLIRDGFKPAQAAPQLQGATDAEIQMLVEGKDSTLRWCRWSLEKYGWIKRLGIERCILKGHPELPVWVVTDKDPGETVPDGKVRFNTEKLEIGEIEEGLVIDVDNWVEVPIESPPF